MRPLWAPGTRFDYSGGGFIAAEMMFEEATGESFRDYLNQHLIEGMGLTRSSFDAPVKEPKLAVGCPLSSCLNPAAPDIIAVATPKAASGLIAHPMDIARFAQIFMNDGLDETGARVIRRRDIRAVMTPGRLIHHTATPCSGDGGCPTLLSSTPGGSAKLTCFRNMCWHHIPHDPDDPASQWYGLGLYLSHDLHTDGYPVDVGHGGSSNEDPDAIFGVQTQLEMRGDEREAIAIFLNGAFGESDETLRLVEEMILDVYFDVHG